MGAVGNQLLILLISFRGAFKRRWRSWESVTNPLDKLLAPSVHTGGLLGISY